MTIALEVTLVAVVLAAWLSTAAYFRLRTPFARIHVITFTNVVAGGMTTLAAFLTSGAAPGSFKVAFIWLATLPIGAVLSHATGRALHVREVDFK